MQKLEKILEEIEMKKKKCLDIVRVEIDPMEITIHREQYKGLRMAEDIIRKHMNDGKCGECSRRKWYQKGFEDGSKNNDSWVSVDDRLPEDAESKKGKRQRMTNADRVRQMDDDELADFIIKGCIGEKRACCSHDETVEWLRWEDSISNGEG